jgi:NAD-dependent deacetylase
MILDEVRRAAKLIYFSKKAVAVTGAGVSTESGIPDFRSDKSLLWERIHAYRFMPIDAYRDGAEDYIGMFWRYWFPLLLPMMDARPNLNHLFLSHLSEANLLSVVITQNTDGLHQKAGSPRVLEIHGNLRYAHCYSCNAHYDMKFVQQEIEGLRLPPRCPACEGIVGPDVVFGFSRTPDYDEALREAENTDLLLVMGSSLLVEHVKEVVHRALSRGANLVIINNQPTPFDAAADVVINERLSHITRTLWETMERYL